MYHLSTGVSVHLRNYIQIFEEWLYLFLRCNCKSQQLIVWAKEEFVMIKIPELYLLFDKISCPEDFKV